MVTITLIQNDF